MTRIDPAAVIAAAVAAVAFALLSTLEFEGASALVVPLPQRSDLAPPEDWREPGEVLNVPGRHVHYWGRPGTYSIRATRDSQPFRAVVIHYTRDKPVLNFVRYQHNGDSQRGGHYGYHVYVGKDGGIVQGAPLSARTNHIKPDGHRSRRGIAPDISSANAFGISAVGACKLSRKIYLGCEAWQATQAQERAIIETVLAVRERYNIPCTAVYGHGELQSDRRSYEGTALAKRLRGECL